LGPGGPDSPNGDPARPTPRARTKRLNRLKVTVKNAKPPLTGRPKVLQFCPKCGSTLLPQKKEKKVFLACNKCGYTSTRSDKVVSRLTQDTEKIIVIGKEEQKIRTLPKAKAECPKCNNHEAFYWLVQTRGADESSTQFFRCTNCGATWRENS